MTRHYDQHKQTPFGKKVRIKPAQLDWLRKNKGKYTLAGKLDEIINDYKNRMGQPKPAHR